MTETETPVKKQTNPFVFVAIGCIALIFILGVGSTIFFKFFAKKAIEGVIENKTGVDISQAEEGKMTYTDSETGTTVDIGSGKVPDNFPKDFPLYPDAKVASALSGAQSGKSNGFWLTLTTPDGIDKVNAFYKTQLAANGWTISSTYTADDTTTQTITKKDWNGSLATSKDSSNPETQIVIFLGQDETAPVAE